MTLRAWVVGQNEAPILHSGWYDRCPDWFGLPFRESFPESEIHLPGWQHGDTAILMVASYRALFEDPQGLTVEWGETIQEYSLSRPQPDVGWETLRLTCPAYSPSEPPPCLRLRTEPWRHGDFENLPDFRPVGILFGGIFLQPRSKG